MQTPALFAGEANAQAATTIVDTREAPNLLERVYRFNVIGQTVPPGPHFNADRVCFYTGMQCEELAEKLIAIADGEVNHDDRERMRDYAFTLDRLGKEFKEGKHYGPVLRADREALLDADIDVLVVTTGSMTYQTPHFREATAHVLDKNDAKFQLVNGVPTAVRDANGKIMKPAGWTAPDLSRFIDPPNY